MEWFSVGRWQGDEVVVESVGFDVRTWLDKLGYPHSEDLLPQERAPARRLGMLEAVITITYSTFYTEPRRSDVKRFRLNSGKGQRWDSTDLLQSPAEEMTYQDLAL